MPSEFEIFVSAVSRAGPNCGALGKEGLVLPPDPDYGYPTTPLNAVTFGRMGVDGVHYAILSIDGKISDESPVVYISPMDSESLFVMASSFAEYLALGCGVPLAQIRELFRAEANGGEVLVKFLASRFDHSCVTEDWSRIEELTRSLGHMAKSRPLIRS